jgi:hypothetical protein
MISEYPSAVQVNISFQGKWTGGCDSYNFLNSSVEPTT